MASSRSSRPGRRVATGLESAVVASLAGVPRAGARIAVALSGGVDSVVLLDVLARLAPRAKFRVRAIHVNHHLSPNAGRWAEFCRRLCRRHRIPLAVVDVTVRRGNSLEGAARAARYAAFAGTGAEWIALAHNQDDQAETLLLQLLRGAGVKGVAAMPVVSPPPPEQAAAGGPEAESKSRKPFPAPGVATNRPRLLRPLLDVPRADILDYARRRRLQWVEDESNADRKLARNFLRHEVLPVVARKFPGYRATLARAARHFAAAGEVLDEVAASDGAQGLAPDSLSVAVLRELSPARAANLLRYFLHKNGVAMPGTERLGEALRQALGARRDAQVLIELGDAHLRRFGARLYVTPAAIVAPPPDFEMPWRGESRITIGELGGMLTMRKSRAPGIDRALIESGTVTVRVRRGGERLKPDCTRPRRSLKNLLQESHIPPWQRERLPLLYCNDALVWVPGIGIDCAYQARAGEPALVPGWTPLT